MRSAGRRRRAGRRLIALAVGLAVAFAAAASLANAELSASGNLFVTFYGGILPAGLPRHGRAPITVWLGGKVRTLSGTHPPALREITIKLNRLGHLDTRGLPTCRRRQLEAVTSARALGACADALVGSGRYRAKLAFPEQPPSPVNGTILAFNSIAHGSPVILAQIYDREPVPSTRVVVFEIHHTSGVYGTVLTGSFPASINQWGYLKRIRLNLHRTYIYRGRTHSYLSAACPAPRGATEGSFPFAFSSMTFADGRTLSATLTRTCEVQ
jgi:hypothetical protein